MRPGKKTSKRPLNGKMVVITGQFADITRFQAETMVNMLGGKLSSDVDTNTDLLLYGSKVGAKKVKAEELGIEIADEAAILKMIVDSGEKVPAALQMSGASHRHRQSRSPIQPFRSRKVHKEVERRSKDRLDDIKKLLVSENEGSWYQAGEQLRAMKVTMLNLSWSNIKDEALAHISGLSELTELNLGGCHNLKSISLTNLMNLTTLNLSGCRNLELFNLSGSNDLKVLNFSGCWNLKDQNFGNISKMTHLSEINLGRCRSLKSINLSGLTFLKTLGLRSCKGLSSVHLSGLTSLKSLDLRWVINMRDLDLSDLTHLTELNLGGCKNLKSVNISGLSQLKILLLNKNIEFMHLFGLNNLSELDLSNCIKLTDVGISSLKDLNNLQKIDLTGCENLSKDKIREFQDILQ